LVLTVGDTMQSCLGAIVRPHGCQPAFERRAWRDSNATAEPNIGIEAFLVDLNADLPLSPGSCRPTAESIGRKERLVNRVKIKPAVIDTGLRDTKVDVLHSFLITSARYQAPKYLSNARWLACPRLSKSWIS